MNHKLLKELPERFVILFSKTKTVASQVYNYTQACYQVARLGDRVILKHTELKHHHVYAQLVDRHAKSNKCGEGEPLR